MDLGTIKDRLRELLFENVPVRELVMPAPAEESISLRDNWLTRYCLDVPYLDKTITDERVLLGIEALPLRINSLIDIAVTITIYCHRNLVSLPDDERASYKEKYGFAGNRVDMIMMAINNALCTETISRSFGVGKLRFSTKDPIAVSYTHLTLPTN